MPDPGLLALLVVLLTAVHWFWRAWRVAVPRSPRLHQALWGAGLALGVFALINDGGPLAAWATGLGVLFLYLVSTGAQRVDDDGVAVGDTIPAFTLPDADGAAFDSATLAGSRVLLKFFRGHW